MYKFIVLIFLISTFHVGVLSENEKIQFMPSLPIGVPSSSDILCKQHTELYRESLKNLTLWAYEMLDSTAKSSSGVLRGNVFNMGNFDQCLTSRAPFQTKYCLATIVANVPEPDVKRPDEISLEFEPDENVLKRLYKYKDKTQQSRNVINVGWCIPASCQNSELETSLNEYFRNGESGTILDQFNVTFSGKINEMFCQTENESKYFDWLDISFCVLSAFIAILVLAGSSYDYGNDETDNEIETSKSFSQKMLLAFSVKRNWIDLRKTDEKNKALKILYGIKTLSICFIIIDHRFGTFVSSAIMNFDFVEQAYRSPLACFIFHGDLFVDTFFIFSGLLVTYGLLGQFEKRKINPGFIIILRYIRLTPVYAFVIFYYATLFNHTGSGPLWKLIAGGDSQDCRNNWWTNLLYISNYVNADHMCMTHSWYLPCDFHYFVIAIALCLIIQKNKKSGLYILLMVVVISVLIPLGITVYFKRPSMLFFYPDFLTSPKNHPDFLMTYSKSHTRATPYFIGMLSGYVYHKLKGTNHHVPMKTSLTIVTISMVLLVGSILTGAVFYDPYHAYNALESGLYSGLHRVAWALGTVGILYVASYGHAIPLKRILTWSPWIPLSKLIYSAYLIHMQFQLRAAAKFMSPRKIGYFDTISLALSDIVLAFFSALVLYLAIEAPLRNIFKELLSPNKSSERNSLNIKDVKSVVEEEPVMEVNRIEKMVHNSKQVTSRL